MEHVNRRCNRFFLELPHIESLLLAAMRTVDLSQSLTHKSNNEYDVNISGLWSCFRLKSTLDDSPKQFLEVTKDLHHTLTHTHDTHPFQRNQHRLIIVLRLYVIRQ